MTTIQSLNNAVPRRTLRPTADGRVWFQAGADGTIDASGVESSDIATDPIYFGLRNLTNRRVHRRRAV